VCRAPTDAALASDLQAVKQFGLNTVRLHQKMNSQRWYYWADVFGVAVMHDGVQKYGGATNSTIAPFLHDLFAMMDNTYVQREGRTAVTSGQQQPCAAAGAHRAS
jgi:beta-galactosidase/beta-glucuronidase